MDKDGDTVVADDVLDGFLAVLVLDGLGLGRLDRTAGVREVSGVIDKGHESRAGAFTGDAHRYSWCSLLIGVSPREADLQHGVRTGYFNGGSVAVAATTRTSKNRRS